MTTKEYDQEHMTALLKDFLTKDMTDKPVNIRIADLKVNTIKQKVSDTKVIDKAVTIDVNYFVELNGNTVKGFYRMDYDEFCKRTGGFAQLFECIAEELFERSKMQ